MSNWYVRPAGGSYGNEDGTSYADAWVKFEFYNSHDGHAAGNEISWEEETATAGAAYVQRVIMIA